MKLWLDTVDINGVLKGNKLGILSGVTTNPTLIAESKRHVKPVLHDLLYHQKGPVTVQVVGDIAEEMVREGREYFSFSDRLIIKIPVTPNGLEAIHLLSNLEIPTMGTAVFNSKQALLAALAGADYIAPYLGRIEREGENPWELLKSVLKIFQNGQFKTKILAASLPSCDYVIRCAEIGIHAVTVKESVFEKLIETDPLTEKAVEKFNSDWRGNTL